MFQNLDPSEVLSCTAARWSPQIGDPTITGWITVAAYLVCAGLAMRVMRNLPRGRPRIFWTIICLAMLFLAVNKQLDLQSALTAIGRCISQLQGWYAERRSFQREFIAGLLGITAALLILGLYLLRRDLRRNGLALLGLVVLGGFVAVRAVGFHHFDTLIKENLFDVRLNVVMELAGLMLIAVNAIVLQVRPSPSPRHTEAGKGS
jgi:hypothetical protein